jgi:hypothetical protein
VSRLAPRVHILISIFTITDTLYWHSILTLYSDILYHKVDGVDQGRQVHDETDERPAREVRDEN